MIQYSCMIYMSTYETYEDHSAATKKNARHLILPLKTLQIQKFAQVPTCLNRCMRLIVLPANPDCLSQSRGRIQSGIQKKIINCLKKFWTLSNCFRNFKFSSPININFNHHKIVHWCGCNKTTQKTVSLSEITRKSFRTWIYDHWNIEQAAFVTNIVRDWTPS